MHRPAVDIYSGEMIGITDSCLADLRKIFRTNGRTYIYAANGHGGWEAAFSNVLSRGEPGAGAARAGASRSAGARWPG